MAGSPDDVHDAHGAAERLRTERNVWLATVRPDGRPHVAPVWFVHVDDRIWIGTGAGSVRVRNLASNPRVTVTLEDGDRPVVAEGEASVHPSERPPDVVRAFLDKYGWDVTIEVDEDVGEVVLVEVRPRRWLFGVELPTST
ncbi:MAG: pyridoxamine 5'-phosphate oxidase family protein [Actinomycetota bacterium]